MSSVKSSQDMRIYDFNTLKKINNKKIYLMLILLK